MNNKTPQVSIGMPVHNGAKYIREALDSLLAQTFTDFELIISDNASTDATEAICLGYAASDSRIRYVRQNANLGAPENFKFVLKEAVGKYFMWAAADDARAPEFLATAMRFINQNSSCMAATITRNRKTGFSAMQTMANLIPELGVYENLKRNIVIPSPWYIYGLHRRKDILWVLDHIFFDWFDCYFTARLITMSGVCMLRNYVGSYAGVDGLEYVVKPFNGKRLRSWPFLKAYLLLILRSRKTSSPQKAHLLILLLLHVWAMRLSFHAREFAKKIGVIPGNE